jgi:hypothetical protein
MNGFNAKVSNKTSWDSGDRSECQYDEKILIEQCRATSMMSGMPVLINVEPFL